MPAALVAVVLLLLVAVQLGPVRARVLAAITARLADRHLDLSAARLDYNPLTLSARLEQVRLGAAAEGARTAPQPFLEADEIRVDLPWSILAGRVAIDRVDVVRPRLTVVRDEQGELNLPRAGGGGGGLTRLPIGAVRVDDGNVQYVDRQQGFSIDASGLALALQPVAAGVAAGPLSVVALQVAAAGRETETTKVEGGVRYDGADVALESLHAVAPEGELRLDGRLASIYASPEVDLTYRATLDLAHLAPWLSIARAPAGTLGASGRITGALADPQVAVSLSGEGLSWAAWRDVAVAGDVSVSPDGAAVRSLGITSPEGRATATATLDFSRSGESRAHAEWHNVSVAAVLDAIDQALPVRLAARLDGTADASWRAARLDALELRAENTTRPPVAPAGRALALDGTARLVITNGAYRLDQTHRVGGAVEIAGLAEGVLAADGVAASSLRGTARVTAGDLAAAVRRLAAAGLDLSALGPLDLAGRARAELALSGTVGRPRATGPITGAGVRLLGAPPASLSASLTLSPAEVRADGIDLRAGGNRLRGHVAAALDRRTLTGEVTGDLGALGDALGGTPSRWRPTGAATVTATLGGTFAAPLIDATVSGRDLAVAGQRAQSLRAAIRLDGSTLHLTSLELAQPGGGRLDASGAYALASGRYSVKAHGTHVAVHPVPAAAAERTLPLDASVDVQIEAAGEGDRPSGTADVTVHHVAWDGHEAGPGHVGLSLDRGLATVDLTATDLSTSVHGTVSIPAPRRFTARAEAAGLDLARLARLLGSPDAHLGGVADLTASVSGDLDHFDAVGGEIDLRRLEATRESNVIALVEPATVAYRDGVFTVGRTVLRAGKTSLTASGRLARGGTGGELDLTLAGDVQDLLPFVPGAGDRDGLEAAGGLTLRVKATGSLDRPDVTGDLTIVDGRVAVAGLPAADALGVTASYRAGVLDVRALRGVWQGAVVTGSGRVPARLLAEWLPAGYVASLPEGGGPARLSARVEPVTRAALAPWVSSDALAQLNLSAAASLTLEAARPALDAVSGALALDRLSLSAAGVPIQAERPTRLAIADGRVTVEDWIWTGGGARLAVTGGADLVDRRLDLTVKGASDLRVLSAFVPGAAAGGTADVDVRVRGPVDDPELDGRIAFTGGEFGLRSPRFAATDLAGTITLVRNRIVVDGLRGNANGGSIRIQGALEHAGFALTGGVLSLAGQDIALDVPAGLRTEVDADLKLDAGGDVPTIGGTVTIVRGAYREPIVLTGQVLDLLRSGSYLPPPAAEPSALDRVRLNVAVVTASDLIVDDNYGRLSIGADLRVAGTIGRPALGGRAMLREGGQLFLGGNTFQIQQGTVDFVNPNGITPDLNFSAQTRVASSYDITLNVSGTPDTIKASLSSADGSLGQADIVSLLTTGRKLADAGTAGSGAGDQAALRLLSGDILGFAGRAIGVDTLRLTQNEPTDEFTADPSLAASTVDPATRLTLSKNLSRQVEIILSQSLRGGGLTWIAVYRPIPNLDVRGVSRGDGSRSYETFQSLSFGGAPRRGVEGRAAPPQVADVRIIGTPGVEHGELQRRLFLHAGDRFDFFTWREDRDRLQRFYRDRDYLEARVTASRTLAQDGRVTLTYDIERGPKTTLRVEGYRLSGDVRDRLRDRWSTAVFDGFLLEDLRATVRTALARAGYLRAAVIDRVEREGTGAGAVKTIVIAITPGPATATRHLAFSGNTHVAGDQLRLVLTAESLDLQAWLDPPKAESALRAYYRGEGYLDATARVGEPAFDAGSATLPILIDEGPQYRVTAVSVTGARGLSEDAVRKAFGVPVDAPYAFERIDAGRRQVEQAYHRDGFADAQVTVAPDVSRERAGVALALDVKEGPQRVLAGVEVTGASGTSPSVVNRAIRAKPGAPVDPEAWYQARRRLYDTGVFRTADVEFTPVGEPATTDGVTRQPVRADVMLRESAPWRLRYGFRLDDQVAPSGTGRDLSPGVLADLQQRNLFGRAIGAGIIGTWQRNLKLARAFLTMPRLVALPIKTNIFLTRWRRNDPTFVEDTSELSAEQQLRPGGNVEVTYGYRFNRDHVFDPNADPTDPLALDFTVNTARLNGAVVIDTRTDPFDSKRGWFHSSNFEYAAIVLGSDSRFVKYLGQQYYYHEVGVVTLASAVRFGAGRGIGQDLLVNEKFFTGGATTVRGYAQDSLGPTDFFGPTGGNAVLVLNQEARFPVYRWVHAVGFVDAGNVFPTLRDLSFGGLKVGVGVGLRLYTPFALVRVDFGVPLSREPGTPKGRWYFSFGQIF